MKNYTLKDNNIMNEPGKTCPICDKQVGYWPIIKAPLPNLIKCEHCKSTLSYEKNGWRLIIYSLILYLIMVGGLIGIAYFNIDKIVITQFIISWSLSSLLYWVLIEFLITYYLRSKEKLIAKNFLKQQPKRQSTD